MKLITGLGNPGIQYKNTRHNAGFMAIDALADELGLKWQDSKKLKAQIAKGTGAILLKPQTFMNNSGLAVQAALSYYKIHPLDKGGWGDYLTVIHDDLDIELGKFKIAIDSRSAGHKGVASIISQLDTKNFKRIRIGIKTPALEKIPADKFVLQKFNAIELKIIIKLISQIKIELA